MSTRLFSFRMQDSTYERLAEQARLSGESKSALAQRLIEEGLRVERHPGVVFRDGPTGRRAALRRGPDVWEMIPALRSALSGEDTAIQEAAERTGLTPKEVRVAIGYYAEFPAEIDERIRSNDALAERLEAEWLRARQIPVG